MIKTKSKEILFFALLPPIILGVIFYVNNMHLVHFDLTLPVFLLIVFLMLCMWNVVFYKIKYILYFPLALSVGVVITSTILREVLFDKKLVVLFVSIFSLFIVHFSKRFHSKLLIFIAFFLTSYLVQGLFFFTNKIESSSSYAKSFNFKEFNSPLKKTYNVYYFLADGYSSFETLKTQDNIDNSKFLKWLSDRNFSTNENAYSNYPKTYISMQSTFEMKHHYWEGMNIHTTETPHGKDIMYNGLNPVMARFYNSGYKTYISYKNATDMSWFSSYYYLELIYYKFSAILNLPYYMSYLPLYSHQIIKSLYKDGFQVIKQGSILEPFSSSVINSKIMNNNEKRFLYTHSGLTVASLCVKDKSDYLHQKGYKQQVNCVNKDIKKSVDFIIKNDPNSIIILQADHGSIARDSFGDGSRENVEKGNFHQKFFGILFSVRWPKDCQYLGSEKYSPINLFPRVFACINAEKPSYQSMREDDSFIIESWWKPQIKTPAFKKVNVIGKDKKENVYKVIENGQILFK